MKSDPIFKHKNFFKLFFYFMVVYFTYNTISHLFYFYSIGGHPWVQGDWLINSIEVDIRRGIFGSILIYLSEFIKINPILLTIIFQFLFFTYSIILLFQFIKNINTQYSLLLILSPLFYLSHWSFSMISSFRKEILIYISFLLIFKIKDSKLYLYLSMLFLIIAMTGHEMAIFFLPAWLYVIQTLYKKNIFKKQKIIFILFISTIIVILFYAILNKNAPPILVCKPLINYINESFCTGNTAIGWLDKSHLYALERIKSEFFKKNNYLFFTIYFLSFLNLYYYCYIIKKDYFFTIALGISFISISPLFILGYDWGRWVSIQYMICMFIISSKIIQSNEIKNIKPKLNYFLFFIFYFLTFFVHFSHKATLI